MKCPHCGIHYMDGERECPVCGKRAGLIAPKKKSKFSNADMESARRIAAKASKSAASTERTQTYNHKKPDSTEAAWERAAAGAHSHDNPFERTPRRKSSKASGCLVVVVLLVIISAVTGIFSAIPYHILTDPTTGWLEDEFGEDIYEYCDPSDAFPTGTWVNEDNSLTMIVNENGEVWWSDGVEAFTDDAPLFEHLKLTEDNASDYCTDTELEIYPISSYTQYTLWASVWDDAADESHSLDLCMYIPNDADTDTLTSFDYYDRDTYEYHTFTYFSDATVLPESVMTTPDAQPA